MTGSFDDITYNQLSQSYTINNINVSKLDIGDYELSVTISQNNYSDVTQGIPFVIRPHGTEILYVPPESIPWGLNISTIRIWFHDTDNITNYPLILESNVKINETGENLAFGSLSQTGNSYFINDINVSWIKTSGTYSLNISIIAPSAKYYSASTIIHFTVRKHQTELIYTPPDKIPWGFNLSIDFQFHDLDNDSYPVLQRSQIRINETGVNSSFALTGASPDYTLSNINVSWNLIQGTYYLNVSIVPNTSLYDSTSRLIAFVVRAHTSELLYDPPSKIPWRENTSLLIQFKDTDDNLKEESMVLPDDKSTQETIMEFQKYLENQ